ncbi:MAG: lamin tail domain-containing protein [Candidatus Bathyarchaeia archaeon]|jgi:hypothetical protein
MLGFRKTTALTAVISAFLLANMFFGVLLCGGSLVTPDLVADCITVYASVVVSNQNTSFSGLVINEFMADNGITIAGPDGTTPDWIELYNGSNQTIDLNGMFLTDNLNNPTKWAFPEGITIESGEYLIIWASSGGQGTLHAPFGLNANGEEIGLFASDGVTLIDSIVFTKQLQDVSYGRLPNGSSTWDYLEMATPGWENGKTSDGPKTSAWGIFVCTIIFVVIVFSVLFISKIRSKVEQK